jgi:hypothetical protein
VTEDLKRSNNIGKLLPADSPRARQRDRCSMTFNESRPTIIVIQGGLSARDDRERLRTAANIAGADLIEFLAWGTTCPAARYSKIADAIKSVAKRACLDASQAMPK